MPASWTTPPPSPISKCDIVLHALVDASYLVRSHARSVPGGLFFLGDVDKPTKINGIILPFSAIISPYLPVHNMPQLSTRCSTILDTRSSAHSSGATARNTDSVKQKRLKAIDMRFHWVRNRVSQKQFRIANIASAEISLTISRRIYRTKLTAPDSCPTLPLHLHHICNYNLRTYSNMK